VSGTAGDYHAAVTALTRRVHHCVLRLVESEETSAFVKHLNEPLQLEVQLFLNRDMIQNVPIFKDCDRNIVLQIVACLESQMYQPGSVRATRTSKRSVLSQLPHNFLPVFVFALAFFFVPATTSCEQGSLAAACTSFGLASVWCCCLSWKALIRQVRCSTAPLGSNSSQSKNWGEGTTLARCVHSHVPAMLARMLAL